MVDNFICFGACAAPGGFNRITDVVSRIIRSKGFSCCNYLDDFICSSESFEGCVKAQSYLIFVLRRLGFYINWPKTTSLSLQCRYLGAIIDSASMQIYLPEDKKIRSELLSFGSRKFASKKQLRRLSGLLAQARKVVWGGRWFSRRLFEFMCSMPEKVSLQLSSEVLNDIDWWIKGFELFNGKANLIVEPDWIFGSGTLLQNWFVCAVGEKCVVGSIEVWELDMPEKYIVSPHAMILCLPLLLKKYFFVVELMVPLYGVQHLINVKDRRLMVCCNSRSVENLFRSAKCPLVWVVGQWSVVGGRCPLIVLLMLCFLTCRLARCSGGGGQGGRRLLVVLIVFAVLNGGNIDSLLISGV